MGRRPPHAAVWGSKASLFGAAGAAPSRVVKQLRRRLQHRRRAGWSIPLKSNNGLAPGVPVAVPNSGLAAEHQA